MSELDDILNQYRWTIASLSDTDAVKSVFDVADKETKQAIKELFLGIVGHTSFTKGDTYNKTLIVSTIATFQQELRQKIKKL